MKAGDGTLDLGGPGACGLAGNLVVEGGFIAANHAAALGGSGTALVFDGGGLQATGSFTIPSGKEIDVRAGGATFDTNGYTLGIDAALGCTSTSSDGADGGVTVMDTSSNAEGVLRLTGDNICLGGTTIASGTLAIGPRRPGLRPELTPGAGTLKATSDLTLANIQTIDTPDDPTLAVTIDSNGYSVSIPGGIVGRAV